MDGVWLTGRLICRNQAEAQIVRQQLDRHVEATRAELGCVSFDVVPTADPLVWLVGEHFADRVAFRAHQDRVAASEWGRATADIERDYTVTGA